MWSIILILLGVGAEIVMANNWFIIPEFVPYVLFGLAGLLAVINFRLQSILYFTYLASL